MRWLRQNQAIIMPNWVWVFVVVATVLALIDIFDC